VELPRVGIVYGHAGATSIPVKAMIAAGFDGIVHAGVGNGNLRTPVLAALKDAVKRGIVVVRSSRVGAGPTTRVGEVDDARYGFVAAGSLTPQKARVLLMLAMTQARSVEQVRLAFAPY